MRRLAALLITLAVCSGMVSCAWSIGGTHIHKSTLGDELTDLEEANEKGIISDEEYEKAKKSLLERDEED